MLKFSPSDAERWLLACPAFSTLSPLARRMPSSEAAQLGTDAHLVGEIALKTNTPVDWLDMALEQTSRDAVAYYVDWVRDLEKYTEAKAVIEYFFSIKAHGQDIRGKIDCMVIDQQRREAYLVDYKNGSGKIVDVYDNPQLLLYAVAAYFYCKERNITIDKYKLVIVQPRAFDIEPVKTWDVSPDALRPRVDTMLDRIKYNCDNPDEYHIGPHCDWCRALTLCPMFRTQMSIVTEPKDPIEMTVDEIKNILDLTPRIRSYLKAVDELARDMIYHKQARPKDFGLKYVEQRTNRAWVHPDKIVDELLCAGEMDLVTWKLKGLGYMAKVKGKAWVQDRVIKPAGSRVLVPTDDKRKEIVPMEDLRDQFEQGE